MRRITLTSQSRSIGEKNHPNEAVFLASDDGRASTLKSATVSKLEGELSVSGETAIVHF